MPSTDFVDFRPPAVNAEWLNEVNDYVFGGSLTSPSGGKKDAMNVLIQSMGYDTFVDYAAGLAMGATTQTVLYQGVIYAPNLADLPFVTSGAFEAAKFYEVTIDPLYRTAASLAKDGIPFTQAGTGAVARTSTDKMRDSVSVLDFGAVGNGIKDDTDAIQKSVNYAQSTGKLLYVPSGTYLLKGSGTELILIDGGLPFDIVGDGPAVSKFLVDATVPISTDMFRVLPGTGQAMSGMVWKNFSILPNSGSPGKDALVFDLSTAAANDVFSRINMRNLVLYGGSGVAMKVGNTDVKSESWYNNTMTGCILKGGANLHRIGDHNHFEDCNFFAGAPALFLTMVNTGSVAVAHCTFRNCSFTSSTGAIIVEDAAFLGFEQCAVETCTGNTTNSSVVDIRGGTGPVNHVMFDSCSIVGSGTDDVIRSDSVLFLDVCRSYVSTIGTGIAVKLTANNSYPTIRGSGLYSSGATIVSDPSLTLAMWRNEYGIAKLDRVNAIYLYEGSVYKGSITTSSGNVGISPSGGAVNIASYGKNVSLALFNDGSNSKVCVLSPDTLTLDGSIIRSGTGVPAFSAPKGSIFLRNDGGAGSCLYVNESGSTTWTPK